MTEETQETVPGAENANIVYILYIIGPAFGLTGIIGVIMAYVNQGDAPEWVQTHYRYQIRTFWIGLLYLFFGMLLALVFIGWFILLFWVVWLIIRCVKGMKYLEAKQAHPNPTGWMFP